MRTLPVLHLTAQHPKLYLDHRQAEAKHRVMGEKGGRLHGVDWDVLHAAKGESSVI